MILYLTYNDQPSGVYWSQVTDVVEHLNTLGQARVELIALVSGRDFLKTRRAIKAHAPSAWVLPMVPTMKRWKKNTMILAWICRLLRPEGIICRGPFATWMALRMRDRGLTNNVCLDGRGAYAAEWEEYRLIDDDTLIAQVRPLENEAVNKSDFRLAVSNALVAHWRERYGYEGHEHVVIPCTIITGSVGRYLNEGLTAEGSRVGQYYQPEHVVLAYSGSTAGWQSFQSMKALLVRILNDQPQVRVEFLSRPDKNTSELVDGFPGRVKVGWFENPRAVALVLVGCDYGIMVREDTITNRVASPTKFAEYLAAGLRVITNEGLGDFSGMVRQHDLGVVLDGSGVVPKLEPLTEAERSRLRTFADKYFTKEAFEVQYRALLSALMA